jgi:hypothetical protein
MLIEVPACEVRVIGAQSQQPALLVPVRPCQGHSHTVVLWRSLLKLLCRRNSDMGRYAADHRRSQPQGGPQSTHTNANVHSGPPHRARVSIDPHRRSRFDPHHSCFDPHHSLFFLLVRKVKVAAVQHPMRQVVMAGREDRTGSVCRLVVVKVVSPWSRFLFDDKSTNHLGKGIVSLHNTYIVNQGC